MPPSVKRRLYVEAFNWEQANSVWPMVERTIRDVNDPIVRFIAFRPIVRFAYFPWHRVLVFSDFTKTAERIEEGLRAYAIAEDVGWAATERAIGKYSFMPLDVQRFFRELDRRAGHGLAPIHVGRPPRAAQPLGV